MRMKNPPHPGIGLRDDIESLGWTIAEAAEALGVTRQQLYNVINGKSAITPEMGIRLEKGIGSTADHWLRLQAAYNLAQARLHATSIKVKKLTPKVA
jgi:addiction module HigA family antidote